MRKSVVGIRKNDSIVENEEVDRNCLEDWFIDSYNNHSGEPPNQDEINCFMRGEYVDYIPGKKSLVSMATFFGVI